MAVVYAVQHQMIRNAQGIWVDKLNLAPAKIYGDITFLLPPEVRPWDKSVLPTLHEKLRWYKREDFLLLLGNPCLIGLTTAVAAAYSKELSFLQWNQQERQYLKVYTDMSRGLPDR